MGLSRLAAGVVVYGCENTCGKQQMLLTGFGSKLGAKNNL
jgi:hypothetical protein